MKKHLSLIAFSLLLLGCKPPPKPISREEAENYLFFHSTGTWTTHKSYYLDSCGNYWVTSDKNDIPIFIITWQKWGVYNSDVSADLFAGDCCALINHTEFFDDQKEALAKKTTLEIDKRNINVKIYEAKQIDK